MLWGQARAVEADLCKGAQAFTKFKTSVGASSSWIAFAELALDCGHLDKPVHFSEILYPHLQKAETTAQRGVTRMKREARSIEQTRLHPEMTESNLMLSKQA